MKKKISILLLITLVSTLVFSACAKKSEKPIEPALPEKTEGTSRVVEVSECGLKYEAPKEWIPYETTNLLPLASVTTEGDIYSHYQFTYIPNKNMDALNSFESEIPVKDLVVPYCEVFVIHKDKLESPDVLNAFSSYNLKEEVSTQGDYTYFLLSDYNKDISILDEKEAIIYEELKKSVPTLKASISSFPFDETKVAEAVAKLNRTITFNSTTLEGTQISSAEFDKYDITIVNFWGSYCYPDINESKVMQELKDSLAQKYPNVNLMQVVIDTPSTEAESQALKAKAEVNGTYTSVMPDKTFANWILDNLQGIPTTVFVNKNAEVIGNQITGVQTSDFYISELEKILNN